MQVSNIATFCSRNLSWRNEVRVRFIIKRNYIRLSIPISKKDILSCNNFIIQPKHLTNNFEVKLCFIHQSKNLYQAIIKRQFHLLMSHRYIGLGLTPLSQKLEPVIEKPLSISSSASNEPLQSSGYLEIAHEALKRTIDKRILRASTTNLDHDVKEFCSSYLNLHYQEKLELLIFISQTLATNHSKVVDLMNYIPNTEVCGTYDKNKGAVSLDKEAFTKWEDKLRQALQPPYYWLTTQISRLSGGVKFIVDLRADVLKVLSDSSLSREDQTALKAFDLSLKELLSLWFTVGLLDLLRITWESPCDILQKVSEYESVHPMRNWTDLKRRVGNYRRCFVFTHSCMPNEPLVVLHTFLTNEISNSMSKIVYTQKNLSFDDSSMKINEDSSVITTAIFYSITSTQKGLQGIELGNYLIKSVVRELQSELPHLSQFSSLSPIPGFTKWLNSNLTKAIKGELDLLAKSELQSLREELEVSDNKDVYSELKLLLKANAWRRNDNLRTLLEPPLMRLCAYYLYLEKRRGYAFDPVANFHLKNGAVMWRINWGADQSPRGMDASCGIMVNYRYFLDDCEKNSQIYLETSKISASDVVIYLAKMAEELIYKKSQLN